MENMGDGEEEGKEENSLKAFQTMNRFGLKHENMKLRLTPNIR